MALVRFLSLRLSVASAASVSAVGLIGLPFWFEYIVAVLEKCLNFVSISSEPSSSAVSEIRIVVL